MLRRAVVAVSEIALTIIKVLFLALLWLFILSAVSVIRSDLFGRTVPRPASRRPKNQSLRHHHPRRRNVNAANRASSPSLREIRLVSPRSSRPG